MIWRPRPDGSAWERQESGRYYVAPGYSFTVSSIAVYPGFPGRPEGTLRVRPGSIRQRAAAPWTARGDDGWAAARSCCRAVVVWFPRFKATSRASHLPLPLPAKTCVASQALHLPRFLLALSNRHCGVGRHGSHSFDQRTASSALLRGRG